MGEKFPIDVTKPEEITGREFYLAVASVGAKERMAKRRDQAGTLTKIGRGFDNLVARLLGEQVRRFEDCDGSMIEVTSRQPHRLEGYMWPTVDSITYERSTPVGQSIPPDKTFKSYIFRPETLSLNNGNGFSMTGQAREFSLHDNTVGDPLEQKVIVHYKKNPTEKDPMTTIACL